jgi:hypothetical protein
MTPCSIVLGGVHFWMVREKRKPLVAGFNRSTIRVLLDLLDQSRVHRAGTDEKVGRSGGGGNRTRAHFSL